MMLTYGRAQFDGEEFWAACIALDEAWQADPTEFCQGLIYLAGGFYHLQQGNARGARLLLELAVDCLAPFAWADSGSPLAKAVAEAINVLQALRAAGGRFDPLRRAYPKLGEVPGSSWHGEPAIAAAKRFLLRNAT
ncbi:MAG TPA: DUF309 domain-containing protein [Symbiobacteriaceae bacterium]|jgi:hypothetical protein